MSSAPVLAITPFIKIEEKPKVIWHRPLQNTENTPLLLGPLYIVMEIPFAQTLINFPITATNGPDGHFIHCKYLNLRMAKLEKTF